MGIQGNYKRAPTAACGFLWVAALIAVAVVSCGCSRASEPVNGGAAQYSSEPFLHFSDGFDDGNLDAWQMPYPEDWVILEENGNQYLHMKRSREPGVPRRPLQFARLKGVNVGSFDLHLRVRREQHSMIVVFNYVDTLHFYYTHLSADPGTKISVHNGIFLVNNAPRVRIAGLEAQPALPDTSWHEIRVRRDAASGKIEVWSDVSPKPLFTAVDRTFTCGQIGIGSFDETGDFDDVRLTSTDFKCKPTGGGK